MPTDTPAGQRAKALKSIGSYGASAKASNVSLSDRLKGYLNSGKQTATEQIAQAGGGVERALNFANRPSQVILQGLQDITGNNTSGRSLKQALTNTSGTNDLNLRSALGKDPNSGGRALGLIDTIGTAALDPLSFLGGTGEAAKVGRLVGKDVLEQGAAKRLSEQGLKALSPQEHGQLVEGLAAHGGGNSTKFVSKTLKALEKPEGITFAGSKTLVPTGKVTNLAKEAFTSTKLGKAVASKANQIADKVSPSGALRTAGVLAKEGAARVRRQASSESNILRSEVNASLTKALKGGSLSHTATEAINGALHSGNVEGVATQLEQSGDQTAANVLRTINDQRSALTAKQLEIGTVKPGELRDTTSYDPRILTTKAQAFLKENPAIAQSVFNGHLNTPSLLKTKGVSLRTFMPDASIKEANDAFEKMHGIRPFEEDPVARWYGKAEQVARDIEHAHIVTGLQALKTGGQGKGGLHLLVDGFDTASTKDAKLARDFAGKALEADTKKWTRRKAINTSSLKAKQTAIKELTKVKTNLVKEGYGSSFKRDATKIANVRSGKAQGGQSLTGAALLANKKADEVARRLQTLKSEESRLLDRAHNIDREKPGPSNVNWRKSQVANLKTAQEKYDSHLISQGYAKVNAGALGEKWALAPVAKHLTELSDAMTPEKVGEFGRLMQNWTTLWKGYATVPFLFGAGFHARNAAGNVWNMFIHGFNNPQYFADSTKATSNIRLGLRSGKTIDKAITDSSLSAARKADIRAAIKEGIVDSAYFHSDFAKHAPVSSKLTRTKTALNPLSTDNTSIKAGRALGSFIEDTSRLAMFLSEMDKHGSAAQASRRVKEALFDYADLSKTDREIKKFVPFWTFASRNIPAQVRGLVEHPGRSLLPAKAQAQQNATDTGDTSVLPQYALQAGQAPIGHGLLGGIQLPQAAAIQQLSPLLTALNYGDKNHRPDQGLAEPIQGLLQNVGGGPLGLLRAGNDIASGASSFSGAPIDSDQKRLKALLGSVNPQFTKEENLRKKLKNGQNLSALLSALGVQNTAINPGTQNAELQRRANVLRTYNQQHGVKSQTGTSKKKAPVKLKGTSFPKP